MSIATELTLLANSKQAIKNSINQKGGSITDSTPFADYSTAIDNLPSGGSGNPLLTSIDVSDFTGTTLDRVAAYITGATIPNTVTSLGNNAFDNCGLLTSITIPSSVTSIGNYAFQSCVGLTSITIPSSVTTIGSYAFYSCSGLTSITISNGVTSIDGQAFGNCKGLKTLTIPSSVTNIGSNIVAGTTYFLKSFVVLSTTPPTLGNNGFNNSDCNIYVPAASVDAYKAASVWSNYASRIYPIQQVATVDGNPVYNYDLGVTDVSTLTDLQVTALPSGDVLEFAEGVQYVQGEITGYTSVTMPSSFVGFSNTQPIGSSVTTLTSKATTPPGVERNNLGGSGLTAIYVPYGYGATYQSAAAWSTFSSIIQELPAPPKAVLTLSNSTTVNVPGDGTTILQKSDVTAVATITDIVSAVVNEGITATSGTLPTTGAFSGATNLSSVTLPSTLTQISGQSFRNTALASIHIPENVASVAPGAFENCPLTSITVDANNSTYTSRNNCNAVIDTTNEILVLGCSSTVIDTDVKTIGASSFKGRTSLTSVTIPDGALTYIEDSAFSGCTSLETVAIGEGIEEMGVSVFSGCNNLTDITILADAAPDASGEDPFDGCDASITMHVPAASVEAYQAWLNDDLGTAADITVVAISE